MQLIDWRDGRPIYEQIVERIKLLILKDVFLPQEQLPSVRSLAMENATNPNTVQKAYTELERQGYLYTMPGRGVFIADSAVLKDRRRQELISELQKLLAEALEIGIDPEALMKEALSRAMSERSPGSPAEEAGGETEGQAQVTAPAGRRTGEGQCAPEEEMMKEEDRL